MPDIRLQYYIGLPSDLGLKLSDTDYKSLQEVKDVFKEDAFLVTHGKVSKVVVFTGNEVLVYTEW